MTPEFSRTLRPETIPAIGRRIEIEADAAECAALARRFGLPAMESLRCAFDLTPGFGQVIDAVGELAARVTQVCVVTTEEFAAEVADRFAVRFVPKGREAFDPDPDAVDELPFDGNTIDLGETAAEQLALVLDPYPRKPGVVAEDAAGPARTPFAALAALKRRAN